MDYRFINRPLTQQCTRTGVLVEGQTPQRAQVNTKQALGSDTTAHRLLPVVGEEEANTQPHTRATGSTGSLQGAIRGQGSTGWMGSDEQSSSAGARGLRRHSGVQSFSLTLGPWCSLCSLSTDNKLGFTCLPRLINHFPEDLSLQLLVMATHGFL